MVVIRLSRGGAKKRPFFHVEKRPLLGAAARKTNHNHDELTEAEKGVILREVKRGWQGKTGSPLAQLPLTPKRRPKHQRLISAQQRTLKVLASIMNILSIENQGARTREI